ncbi:hypothetical protein Bbelb_223070 [Branchiostoma belcheri]|nr:hypothetical protein Bbelb_223070 [Branchiostoma belcheri]
MPQAQFWIRVDYPEPCLSMARAITIVTVTTPEPKVEGVVGGSVELKCEFDIKPNSTQPPTIAWFKGNTDFRGAERIYTGHKVWGNESHRREDSFGDYFGRVEVADLDSPAIKIIGLRTTDFARYWCTVAEWGAHTEFGLDAKSVLLTQHGHAQPSFEVTVSGQKEVAEGADVEMKCQCDGADCTNPVYDWFKGPGFAGSDWVTTGNYTQIAAKVDLGQLGFPPLVEIEDGFGQFSLTPSNSLLLTGAQVSDAGRSVLVQGDQRRECGHQGDRAQGQRRRDLIVRTPRGTPPVAGIPPGHISYVTDQMNRIKPMPARLLNPAGAGRGYIPDGHRLPEFTCAGKADAYYPDPEDCAMYYQFPELEFTCEGRADGYYPDPEDCAMYYQFPEFTCEGRADGYYPDPEDCAMYYQFPDFTCAGKADGYYPDPEDCAMYYQCLTGFLQPTQSHKFPQFTCAVPEFTCAGKADGYYPDPEDCAMYYQCLTGFPQPFHRPCGYAGMVFNPEHLYCDWAFNVGPPCGLVSPFNPEHLYCDWAFNVGPPCGHTGMVFNPEHLYCDWAFNVGPPCGVRDVTTWSQQGLDQRPFATTDEHRRHHWATSPHRLTSLTTEETSSIHCPADVTGTTPCNPPRESPPSRPAPGRQPGNKAPLTSCLPVAVSYLNIYEPQGQGKGYRYSVQCLEAWQMGVGIELGLRGGNSLRVAGIQGSEKPGSRREKGFSVVVTRQPSKGSQRTPGNKDGGREFERSSDTTSSVDSSGNVNIPVILAYVLAGPIIVMFFIALFCYYRKKCRNDQDRAKANDADYVEMRSRALQPLSSFPSVIQSAEVQQYQRNTLEAPRTTQSARENRRGSARPSSHPGALTAHNYEQIDENEEYDPSGHNYCEIKDDDVPGLPFYAATAVVKLPTPASHGTNARLYAASCAEKQTAASDRLYESASDTETSVKRKYGENLCQKVPSRPRAQTL